jgi:GNAT superfamily N-acetyltransferase
VIREAVPQDALAIARVHVNSWRSTYAGLLPQDYLDQIDVEKRAERWEQILSHKKPREGNVVAEADGRIIGFSSTGPSRSPAWSLQGELYALYLEDGHQKKGIGKALFLEAIEQLRSQEMKSMLVWVLKGNPTCGFYQKMGGNLVGQKLESIGGQKVIEVAYAWEQLDAFPHDQSTPPLLNQMK